MKLNENKYLDYSTDQFLLDDFFLESTLNPSPQTEHFWDRQLSENKFEREDFEQAKAFVLSLNESKNMPVSDQRLGALRSRILMSIGQDEAIKRPRRAVVKWIYAAAAACVATLAMLLNSGPALQEQTLDGVKLSDIPMVEMSDKIQLVMSQERVELADDQASIDYSGEEGIRVNEGVYERDASGGRKGGRVAYNQLLVPPGKQSSVVLSDGSKIWVNAGTRVVYPEVFAAEKREIYVDGEIYGDITHNPDRPFVIKTSRMTVEVLGTTLNVSDYTVEQDMSVVLVQGAVRLNYDNGRQLSLRPNEMFYSSEQGGSGVKTVDALGYTSWKDGYLNFKSEKLKDILKKIARFYGTEIVCEQAAGDVKCSGELYLKEDFMTVLDGICKTTSSKFEFENNTYKITKID